MGREGGSKVLCRSIVRPCSTECTRVSLVFMSEQAGIDGNSNRTVFEEVSFVPTQHSSPYLRHRSSLTIDPHLRDFFFPFFHFQFENPSSSRFDCLDRLVNFNDFNPRIPLIIYIIIARVNSIITSSKLKCQLSSKNIIQTILEYFGVYG